MTVNLSMLAGAGAQFFDNNGDPLSGGKVFTYAAGTTTPQATYTTSAGNVAHANPIVLDSAGRVPSGGEIWLTDSISYKFVLANSTGTTIATYDNITGNGAGVLPSLVASGGSALVGFIQAGLGAIATTVQSKLRQTVSVKDFGAVGDGVTDDAPAILSAAKYVNGLGGGTVYFPPPAVSYAMKPTFFDNLSNVSFIGNGAKIISLLPASSPYSPFHMRYCTDLEIAGFDMDGRYPYWLTQPQAPQFGWNNFNIVITDCVRVNIHDNYLHDSGVNRAAFDKYGDGVIVYGSSSTASNNISITNNKFKDDGRWSVAVLGGSNIDVSNNISVRSSTTCPAIGFIDFEYNPGVGIGENITITNNKCNGACAVFFTQNISPGYRNVSISDNSLNGFYSDGTQRIAGAYTLGFTIRDVENLTVSNNTVYGVAGDNIQVNISNNFSVTGNVLTANTLFPTAGIYSTTSTNGIIASNTIYNNNATGSGLRCLNAENITVIGNFISNAANWGITFTSGAGGGNSLINNVIVGASNSAFSMSGAAMVVSGNISTVAGRLDSQAHTVIGNQMAIGTTGGKWWEGGGRYTIPDANYSKSFLWFSAAPTTGTWKVGDIVKNSSPSVGAPRGWVCTVAGTPGTWVSEGNL